MPLYDFQCTKCQHEFDCLLKIDESYDGVTCPKCGQKSPKKLISSVRFNDFSNFIDTLERKVSPRKFK